MDAVTAGTNHTSPPLDVQREQLLEAMSGVSESRWCAGWLYGLSRRLYEEGGIWQTVGEQTGWPMGDYENWTWVPWEQAGALYFPGADRPCA